MLSLLLLLTAKKKGCQISDDLKLIDNSSSNF
jgi:hypothetical protein